MITQRKDEMPEEIWAKWLPDGAIYDAHGNADKDAVRYIRALLSPPVPVDTISIKKEVLQGVRDNLRIFEATTKAGLSGSGLSERSCWSLNDNANKALASLDAVLAEGGG